MLKQQARLFRRLSMIVDLLLVVISFALAYVVTNNFFAPLAAPQRYLWGVPAVAITWLVLLRKGRLYDSLRSLTLSSIFMRLVKANLLGGLFVAAIIFFVDRDTYSRSLFILFILFLFLLLLATKFAIRLLLGYMRRQGYHVRNVLIVGTAETSRRLHELIAAHSDWGLRIQGFVQVTPLPLQKEILGYEVCGHVDQLVEICKEKTPDEVMFSLSKNPHAETEKYVVDLEEMGITTRVVLNHYKTTNTRREFSMFHNELPVLTVHTKCFDAPQLFLKRLIDVLGACVGLTIFALFFPIVALAIKLDSKGPIFFGQFRLGENAKRFKCWKLRTMGVDAEAQKKALMQQNEMQGAMFKMDDDPRVTRVGNFLRKTSLDEFPQFWNVLRGEMSLVGTRPPTPDEVVQYENWHRRRICIKPGITGLWQVSGRSAIKDFDEIVRLDLQYIDNWSLWLDIKLLLKTLLVVFARRGAC
ncbi:MAG: sugar transferase [Desulfuromonadaceae bacterium]|nr:sugar transferase [Desulfuromonadaceae bacterium]